VEDDHAHLLDARDAGVCRVMLLYLMLAYRRREEDGRMQTADDLRKAIAEGAAHRICPKLMTVLTMMIGLVPVLWSTGTGADVMKRIAAPMVGGLVTSFLLELTVYPAIFAIWKRRGLANVTPKEESCASRSRRPSRRLESSLRLRNGYDERYDHRAVIDLGHAKL
jgi:uncharacterized membrane protein YdfJ with MMPL/SSD domain